MSITIPSLTADGKKILIYAEFEITSFQILLPLSTMRVKKANKANKANKAKCAFTSISKTCLPPIDARKLISSFCQMDKKCKSFNITCILSAKNMH